MNKKFNPQNAGPQYLEDLATGYWFSEALFTAVDMEIFTKIDSKGLSVDQIARMLDLEPQGLQRFLQALCAMGLVTYDGENYYNTAISAEYLVIGKENYQGNSILWRKYLTTAWRDMKKSLQAGGRVNYPAADEDKEQLAERTRFYISAMDCVAKTKVQEILPFFEGYCLNGNILDVGAGSGAITAGFLQHFPDAQATVMDLAGVLEYTRELMQELGLNDRINHCSANILERWPLAKESFDLIILSNIIHAYSEEEFSGLLVNALECLRPDGLLIIHDFFTEHYPAKAALFDLNMFINTYNGKVFSHNWIRAELARLNFSASENVPLKTDTSVIFAAKNQDTLNRLAIDPKTRLCSRIKDIGFNGVYPVSAEDIHVAEWTDLKCRFGCERYGRPHCPPNTPTPQKTRAMLKDYTQALILEGEPPTKDFQLKVLQAEKEAFKNGYSKAFAYWAGPCSICDGCSADGVCHNTGKARPSMEGSGIDVFSTVKKAGITLNTLKNKGEFVRYFALLLLE